MTPQDRGRNGGVEVSDQLSTTGADANAKCRCRVQPRSGDPRYRESSAERRDNDVVLVWVRSIRVDTLNKSRTTLVSDFFADLEFSHACLLGK